MREYRDSNDRCSIRRGSDDRDGVSVMPPNQSLDVQPTPVTSEVNTLAPFDLSLTSPRQRSRS